MMSEWWTYNIRDFLLFSPQTYYRLFELYNIEIWPLQILLLGFGMAMLVLLVRQPDWHGRAISLLLALCWLWVAWAYHWQRYAAINWAALYYAAGFMIQALLLLWFGVVRANLEFEMTKTWVNRCGRLVLLFAILLQPLLIFASARPWTQIELFAVAPDPTVIATLGMVLLLKGRVYASLMVIPIIWCVISGAMLWAMHAAEALLLPLLALLVIVFALYKAFGQKQHT